MRLLSLIWPILHAATSVRSCAPAYQRAEESIANGQFGTPTADQMTKWDLRSGSKGRARRLFTVPATR